MGRPKGSKNKKTLEREAAERAAAQADKPVRIIKLANVSINKTTTFTLPSEVTKPAPITFKVPAPPVAVTPNKPNMKLEGKTGTIIAPVPVPKLSEVVRAVPTAVPSAVPRDVLESAYEKAASEAGKLVTHYRVKALAPHTEAKLLRILTATNPTELQKYVDKAIDSAFMWCLAEWAKGNSPGPKREENAFTLEQEVKKAENLAAFLDKRGKKDNAASQRVRAAELKDKLRSLHVAAPR